MSKGIFTLLAIHLFIFAVISPKGKNQGQATGGQTSVETVEYKKFVRIDEICEQFIVNEYVPYFQRWIIEYLKNNRNNGASDVFGLLSDEYDLHQEVITKYLQDFLKTRGSIPMYSSLLLEVEVGHLLKKMGPLLDVEYDPKYPRTTGDQQPIPHLGLYEKSAEETPLDIPNIDRVGTLFKRDFTKRSDERFQPVFGPAMEYLVPDLKGALIRILEIYLEHPDGSKYQSLTPEQKPLLQAFYNNFYYLLDPQEHRLEVLKIMLGDENKDGTYGKELFTPELFHNLRRHKTAFDPIIVRDDFIVNPSDLQDLEKIHEASNKNHFDWAFMDIFDGDAEDIEFDLDHSDKKQEEPEVARRRQAKLNLLLYKVYTVARQDGTIPPDEEPQTVEVLKKLFDWVVNTHNFDPEDPTEEQPIHVIPARQLIPAEKFRKYFIPLLQLICSKIPGCDLFDQYEDPIAQKYKDYGNFLDMKSKGDKMKQFIPDSLLDKLNQQVAEMEFQDFTKEVLEFQAPLRQQRVATSAPPRRLLPQQKDDPAVQLFQDKIGQKFLPQDPEDKDPNKLKYLSKFLDIVDSSDNNDKKALLKGVLVQYIVKMAKDQNKPDLEKNNLAKLTTKHLIEHLRNSFSYEAVLGLRNFLVYTLTEMYPFAHGNTKVEDILYHLDIIFFVNYAAEDYLQLLEDDPSLEPADKPHLAKAVVSEKQTLLRQRMRTLEPTKNLAQYEKLLKGSRFIMDKMDGFDFFVHFFDFYDYFEKLEAPNATYGDVRSIYTNFYHFLSNIRFAIAKEVRDPYTYLLERLEECLQFTESPETFAAGEQTTQFCRLSHRKFAEMYFFYKLYMISYDKPGHTDMNPYPTATFNTHTRLFLTFLDQNPSYRNNFNSICEKNPDIALCASWRIYQALSTQLSDFSVPKLNLNEQTIGNVDFTTFEGKMTLVNAMEALHLNVIKGNTKDYEKVLGYLDVNKITEKTTFKPDETEQLATYLKRTYRKYVIDQDEKNIAQAVQSILQGAVNEEDLSQDSLGAYLIFDDRVFLDFIKVFLLYATTDDEYQRIARVLISQKVSMNIVNINNPINDEFYKSLVAQLKRQTKTSQWFETIHEELQRKYAEAMKVCRQSIKNGLLQQTEFAEDFDYMADFLDGEETEANATVQREQEQFAQVVEPQLNEAAAKKTVTVMEGHYIIEEEQDPHSQNIESLYSGEMNVISDLFKVQRQPLGKEDSIDSLANKEYLVNGERQAYGNVDTNRSMIMLPMMAQIKQKVTQAQLEGQEVDVEITDVKDLGSPSNASLSVKQTASIRKKMNKEIIDSMLARKKNSASLQSSALQSEHRSQNSESLHKIILL